MFHFRIRKLTFLAAALGAILLGLVVSSSYPTQKSEEPDSSHTHHKHKEAGQKLEATVSSQRGSGHQRMLQLLKEIAASGAREHPFMGDGRAQELSRQLAEL